MSNLDILIDAERMIETIRRVNNREDSQKIDGSNFSILPLRIKRLDGKTIYCLNYDVEDRSLDNVPIIVDYPTIHITAPFILTDQKAPGYLTEILSEIKNMWGDELDLSAGMNSQIPLEVNAYVCGKWRRLFFGDKKDNSRRDGYWPYKAPLYFLKLKQGIFDELKKRITNENAMIDISLTMLLGDDQEDMSEDEHREDVEFRREFFRKKKYRHWSYSKGQPILQKS